MSRDWHFVRGKVILAHWFFTRDECVSRELVAMFGGIYGCHSSWGAGQVRCYWHLSGRVHSALFLGGN